MSTQHDSTIDFNRARNLSIVPNPSDKETAYTTFAFEPRHHWYLPIKAVAEYLVALLIMIPAIPIICVAALAIKLTSRGPVFYVQTRTGKAGRLFPLIKLRTMVNNAETLTGPVWASTNDNRVTGVGNFLRKSHIDEFPQLINVLLGHMSLIGPRPERPEFFPKLVQEIPHYPQRLRLKPGITGLAQMQLPADSDLESVERKLQHDLYYVHHAGAWLDVKISIWTCMYLLRTTWHFACSLFALPSCDRIEQEVDAMLIVESENALSSAN